MASPNSSPLRILQVSATRTDTLGGLETVVETLRDGLLQRGHTVIQVFLGDQFRQHSAALWEMRLAAPTTHRKIPTLRSALQIVLSSLKLFTLLRAVRPDVVHFNYVTWETAYFVALRSIFRYRLVVTAHGSDLLRTRWPVAKAILPYVLRRATVVTAVSDALVTQAKALQKGQGPPPVLIPNGVDTAFWSSAPAPTTRQRNIVSVGRLQHVKGHDVLIEAFAQVRRYLPDAHLTLIGDGPERSTLMRQVEALGLHDVVAFTGALEPVAIREHLRNATVFALPSRSEGLPVALLEALATGTPVVASGVGGVPNVLATGGGYAIPPEDPSALTDKLRVLLSDSDLRNRMSSEALHRAQEYGASRVIDTYERILAGETLNPQPERPSPPPSRRSSSKPTPPRPGSRERARTFRADGPPA